MSAFTDAKKEYRTEACAEAVITVLKENKQGQKKYLPIKKYKLFNLALAKVEAEWKTGQHFIDGKEIKCPDYKFIKNNWSAIREYATEELKAFICWDLDGFRYGNRAGYELNQGQMIALVKGTANRTNRRADQINKRGGSAKHIQIQLLLPATSV